MHEDRTFCRQNDRCPPDERTEAELEYSNYDEFSQFVSINFHKKTQLLP